MADSEVKVPSFAPGVWAHPWPNCSMHELWDMSMVWVHPAGMDPLELLVLGYCPIGNYRNAINSDLCWPSLRCSGCENYHHSCSNAHSIVVFLHREHFGLAAFASAKESPWLISSPRLIGFGGRAKGCISFSGLGLVSCALQSHILYSHAFFPFRPVRT